MLVVFYHSARVLAKPENGGAEGLGRAFEFGHSGVAFFFVLSGFIMAHVHGTDVSRPERLGNFIGKRLKRIYPLYWTVLLPVVGLALVVGTHRMAAVTPSNFVPSILLVGATYVDTPLIVAWTLFHEMLFYLPFAALILSRRLGTVVAALWLGAIAAAYIAGPVWLPDYVTSPINLLFGFGVVAYLAVKHDWIRAPFGTLIAGLVLFAVFARAEYLIGSAGQIFAGLTLKVIGTVVYGAIMTVVVAAMVTCERRFAVSLPRLGLILGSASYSIYLFHYPALSLVIRVLARLHLIGTLPTVAVFAILAATVTAAGIGFHYAVEAPMLRWFAHRAWRPGAGLAVA